MISKRLLASCIGIAGLALIHTPASAQSGQTEQLHCNSVGYNPSQPLGDRKGHSISFGPFTCRVEGGPLDGGLVTGSGIWEWHQTNAVLLSGMGVTRKPGTTLAWRQLNAKMALIMSDGKVTGFQGSGRGRCTLATGAAAERKGKTYGFTFKSVGPGQWVVDVTYQ
jgi:hypothetical protein